MEDTEIIELYEVSYNDLILLSFSSIDSSSSSCSKQEEERLATVRASVMESLGPTGPGLLSITSVPNASLLRRKILPLARTLALLNPDHRKRVLKEHSLGSDVSMKNPNRKVSAFAMHLKYEQCHESTTQGEPSDLTNDYLNIHQDKLDVDAIKELQDDEFKNLGSTFKELGFMMMELGLSIARVCDSAIGGKELEQSLLESCTAKGRLIHYHSALDNTIPKETQRRNGSNRKRDQEVMVLKSENLGVYGSEIISSGIHSNLWQQWHYDYGIFTVLTNPMFGIDGRTFIASDQEFESYSCLQIYHPTKNKVLMVKSSPESFIIQVGESANILSKGKLCSTLHSVCRPPKLSSLSRETFVVFLLPSWTKSFSIADYPMKHLKLGTQDSSESDSDHANGLAQEIRKIVPPLTSRLKDAMTFAEFSRETTKQYYGGTGLQFNR